MPMTPLPNPPSRNDPTNFADEGDALLSALPAFVTEANALETNVNAKEISAAASALAAYNSEQAVISITDAIAWVSGTTYVTGDVRWSPINFQSYRRKTNGAGTTDPSADSTNWAQLATTPSMTGHSGEFMYTDDGVAASWRVAIPIIEYTDRDDIRSITPTENAVRVIRELGLFIWNVGTAEIDDDESCFATSTGRWTLQTVSPEYVNNSLLAELSNTNDTVTANEAKKLFSSFTMSLTTLAALTSSEFVVTVDGAEVGDTVLVTPGNLFGTATADRSVLSYIAYTSAADEVTISIRNSNATTAAAMSASTWTILVVKQ